MATTLTLAAQPATASVQLTIGTAAADAPVTVLDLTGAAIYADRASWSDLATHATLVGDACVWDPGSTGATIITRPLTGLTVGVKYRATFTYDSPGPAQLSAGGGATPYVRTTATTAGRITESVTWTAGATNQLAAFLNVTPNQLGLVRIRVESVPAGYAFALTRSDANGVRPVRLAAGQEPTGGTPFVVVDYEPALAGPVSYSVTTTTTVTASTTLDGLVADPWISTPVRPQYAATLDLITGLSGERESSGVLQTAIGRADPIGTLGRLRPRTGTLELWCATYADALAVAAVYDRGQVALLRQVEFAGLDMYHVATRVAVEPASVETAVVRWRVRVDYTEVAAPTAALAGALGWTFDAAAAHDATFAAALASFPTFADAIAGP